MAGPTAATQCCSPGPSAAARQRPPTPWLRCVSRAFLMHHAIDCGNSALLSGPVGSGKTAAAYAVATVCRAFQIFSCMAAHACLCLQRGAWRNTRFMSRTRQSCLLGPHMPGTLQFDNPLQAIEMSEGVVSIDCRRQSTTSSRSTPRRTGRARRCCAWWARPRSRSASRLRPRPPLPRRALLPPSATPAPLPLQVCSKPLKDDPLCVAGGLCKWLAAAHEAHH